MEFTIGTLTSLKPLPSMLDKTAQDDAGTTDVPFADYLKSALDTTNSLLLDSESLANDFAAGRTDDVAGVMISAQKAEIALQFTTQVRSKILDAYKEIMNMQI